MLCSYIAQKYTTKPNNETFDDVIEPPFEAESGKSLLWAIEQYGSDYQWVFKLDDVTYVIIENLLSYLSQFDDSRSWWLGNRLQTNSKNKKSVFTSGGAGYLMNKNIIQKIVEDVRGQKDQCSEQEWEDLCVYIHAYK